MTFLPSTIVPPSQSAERSRLPPIKRDFASVPKGVRRPVMIFLRLSRFATSCWIVLATTLVAAAAEDDILLRGEKIYRQACASCHGAQGEGVEGSYDDPLVGDATIGELTELITETMPEEDPDTCVGEDAASVAAYIHHAFYSEAARIRNRPPRVGLARLTGLQLRQSLADLYGHFDREPWSENRRGLEGTYFDGARWKKDKIRIERIDPVLEFDFGDDGPGEKINPQDFYIHWGGSLKVDHTGRYEIVLRSSCSTMFYFGNTRRVLVNNHVQSEGKTEFRRTLQLTAGRSYPIKIEFFQRKRKTEQPPAKVSLSWVPPGGVEEIIPSRNLIPTWMPPQFSVQAKLPPDDRSYGYQRGIAVNRQWDDSTTAAAIEFAQVAVDELWPQYRRRHAKDSDKDRGRLRGFLGELLEVAFRGPLDPKTKQIYIDNQLDQAEDDGEAIKRVVLISLKSPRFLYPTIDDDRSDSQRVANRLALVLHDSLPSDDWLIKKVDANQLQTEKQIDEVARRMAGDQRTQSKIRTFLYHWLHIGDLQEISKDADLFPGFDQHVVSDLRKSLDAFLDDVMASESSDYRQLLQADWTYTSDRLAAYYGDAWKPAEDEGPQLRRSVGDSKVRSGAITHPLLMASFAHHNATSPIHRGVLLYRHVLGRTIRPPQAAFAPLNPDLHPRLTTRERVEMQTGDVDCQVCHQKINSLGFTLENYDPTGRYRSQDNEKPVNALGAYVDRAGKEVSLNGARELADYLASSEDCHRAFVEAAFEHFVKQPIAAYGSDAHERLTKQFIDSGFSIRELVVNIAVLAARQPASKSET